MNETNVNAYVFIARDDEEYSKYGFECNQCWEVGDVESIYKESVYKEFKWQWRFCPESRTLRIILHKGVLDREKLKPDGELSKKVDELVTISKDETRKRRGLLRDVENWVNNIFIKVGDTQQVGALKHLLNGLTSKFFAPCQSSVVVNRCCVFIHWGGGRESRFCTMKGRFPICCPINGGFIPLEQTETSCLVLIGRRSLFLQRPRISKNSARNFLMNRCLLE